ncbi:hypothetical protein ASPVEDRAFT_158880 [Aspergillus versicolor CBS 583.65]|uniref:Amino acid permease/ SLC12A domain-containing protein n=1 Tax=Aspergillus versicolor CBS 583.65 TaxID=1036611 RepID=A0A1L9P613_ASPVE|nr:uncharacterized protein ASPVEDRAFT_158880 [Aspergillus versicolor CBS 583.65]OJI96961.1 hypothetical protein ASPVEDRAFT_158880 [Aspergillus versicolor CBS 583.65]
MFGIGARGIQTPNAMIGVLLFFGGTSQFLAGIMEFVRGQAFGATLWCSYSAFNFSYAMIYVPGTGIMAAYTDSTGATIPEFNQALAIYIWAWFIVNTIYAIGAMRTTWVLFLDLAVLSLGLLLLAVGYMNGSTAVLKAGNAVLLVVAFLSYWAGCSGFWATATPIKVPTFAM